MEPSHFLELAQLGKLLAFPVLHMFDVALLLRKLFLFYSLHNGITSSFYNDKTLQHSVIFQSGSHVEF